MLVVAIVMSALLVVCLGVSAGPVAAAAAAAPAEALCVRADIDFAAVRAAPGTDNAEVGRIPPGTCGVVAVASDSSTGEEWLHVQYGGIDGWSAARLYVPDDTPLPTAPPAVPASSVDLSNAEIPALCGFPAGRLVAGELRVEEVPPDSFMGARLASQVEGDVDGDDVPEVAAEFICTGGGNVFWQAVAVFRNDLTPIGAYDVDQMAIPGFEWTSAAIDALTWEADRFRIDATFSASASDSRSTSAWLTVVAGELQVANADPATPAADEPPDATATVAGHGWVSTRYVQDGSRTEIVISTDGFTWTPVATVEGIVGNVVAVPDGWAALRSDGATNTVLTSPDLRSWTSAGAFDGYLVHVAYGNGRYVAVGASDMVVANRRPVVAWSSDGITWNLVDVPDDLFLRNVTFSGTWFFATRSEPIETDSEDERTILSLYRSADGEHWEELAGAAVLMTYDRVALAPVAGGGLLRAVQALSPGREQDGLPPGVFDAVAILDDAGQVVASSSSSPLQDHPADAIAFADGQYLAAPGCPTATTATPTVPTSSPARTASPGSTSATSSATWAAWRGARSHRQEVTRRRLRRTRGRSRASGWTLFPNSAPNQYGAAAAEPTVRSAT